MKIKDFAHLAKGKKVNIYMAPQLIFLFKGKESLQWGYSKRPAIALQVLQFHSGVCNIPFT